MVTADPNIRFYAGVAIHGPEGYPIGTLCLIDSEPRGLSEEDSESLMDLAGMVDDQIRLSSDATQDTLTKISNRRGFMLLASQVISLSRRAGTETHLLFFDVDNLKVVNDEHGHCEGDKLLSTFATILKTSFRESDIVARFGGDEFVVLLSGDQEAVNQALARLDEVALQTCSDNLVKCSWSVGVVQFDPERHGELIDLISEADERMYKNKRSNRIEAL